MLFVKEVYIRGSRCSFLKRPELTDKKDSLSQASITKLVTAWQLAAPQKCNCCTRGSNETDRKGSSIVAKKLAGSLTAEWKDHDTCGLWARPPVLTPVPMQAYHSHAMKLTPELLKTGTRELPEARGFR